MYVLWHLLRIASKVTKENFTIFLTQLCCSVDVSDARDFVGGFLSSILIPLVASEGIKQLNVGIYIFRTNEDE